MALKENYKDDILDVSVNTKRKYRMTENPDGTISLEDETVYTQQGDSFGASDMNATNGKVNTLDSTVSTLNANLDGFKFYPSGTGIVGLISDDSAYTDEDGNYVIWGTETAEQLVADNPNTYKSVASTEDTRGQVGFDTAKEFGGGSVLKIKETCVYIQINREGNNQQKELVFLNPDTLIGNKNINLINNYTYGVSGSGEYIQFIGGSGKETIKALKKGKFKIYSAKLTLTTTNGTNGYALDTTVDANVGDTIYEFTINQMSGERYLVTVE